MEVDEPKLMLLLLSDVGGVDDAIAPNRRCIRLVHPYSTHPMAGNVPGATNRNTNSHSITSMYPPLMTRSRCARTSARNSEMDPVTLRAASASAASAAASAPAVSLEMPALLSLLVLLLLPSFSWSAPRLCVSRAVVEFDLVGAAVNDVFVFERSVSNASTDGEDDSFTFACFSWASDIEPDASLSVTFEAVFRSWVESAGISL